MKLCFGDISSPYIAVTQTLYKYARYLEFRFLKWPVKKKKKCHFFSESTVSFTARVRALAKKNPWQAQPKSGLTWLEDFYTGE
jgi:hypothetical protein